MTTLPKNLVRAYEDAGYHEWDIMLDYALHNRRGIFYSDLQAKLKATGFESTVQQKNKEIFRLYHVHGYYDFYLIPVGHKGTSALLSVTKRDSSSTDLIEKVACSSYTETGGL